MATMTPSEVRNGNISFGDARGKFVDFAIGTYASNGLAVDPRSFGMNSLLACLFAGGNAAGGKYQYVYDVVNKKLLVYRSGGFTPAGTVAAPVFTGDALAAHRHVLHFQTSAAANAVTAAANALRTAAAAFDVAGVANSSGEGGIVDVTGGTPAGTNSAPVFTGTAVVAGALVEVSNGVDLSLITVRLLGIGF